MIALIQRVSSASVFVKDRSAEKSAISSGMLILLGVSQEDTADDVDKLAAKLGKLRIFSDETGKMNLDIRESKGEILLISQFTLIADTKGGNRPSFIKAAAPDQARLLYESLSGKLREMGIPLHNGFFGEYMIIEAALDGPVTISLDTKEK